MKKLKIALLTASLMVLPVWASQAAEPAPPAVELKDTGMKAPEIKSLDGYLEHWDQMKVRKEEWKARKAAEAAAGDNKDADSKEGKKHGGNYRHMDPDKQKALKEELMKLPPEEREKRMNELRDQMKQKREKAMEERRAQFQQNWDKATPEEKTSFCAGAKTRCDEQKADDAQKTEDGDSPHKGKFCEMIQEKCAGP
jgi:hypothetical protein